MKLSKAKIIIASTLAGLMAIGGTAIAYWTTSGAGTGSATAGTNTAVIVTQVGTITALVPGSPAQPIDFKINNPASTNQYVTNVSVAITSVTPAVGAPAGGHPCAAGDFTLTQPVFTAADLVPGFTSFLANGATLKLDNLLTNQDNCKQATVNLTFTAV